MCVYMCVSVCECVCIYIFIYKKTACVAKASDTQAAGHGFEPRPDH